MRFPRAQLLAVMLVCAHCAFKVVHNSEHSTSCCTVSAASAPHDLPSGTHARAHTHTNPESGNACNSAHRFGLAEDGEVPLHVCGQHKRNYGGAQLLVVHKAEVTEEVPALARRKKNTEHG